MDGTAGISEARWMLLVPHRERLVGLLIHRGTSPADAEDCAQEALLRVARMERVEVATLEPLLNRVALNLATDLHRRRQRELRAQWRLLLEPPEHPDAELAVTTAHEARWWAGHAARLSERERAVLALRAAGLGASETARHLGITPAAAASAFTRARIALRAIAATALGILAGLLRRWRWRRGGPVAAAGVLAVAAAVVVVLAPPPPHSPRLPGLSQPPQVPQLSGPPAALDVPAAVVAAARNTAPSAPRAVLAVAAPAASTVSRTIAPPGGGASPNPSPSPSPSPSPGPPSLPVPVPEVTLDLPGNGPVVVGGQSVPSPPPLP